MRPGEWRFTDMDEVIRNFVTARFPDHSISILDMGAGGGAYRDLCAGYPNMDAVDIWQQYINEERLADRYRKVFCADIRTFDFDFYNLIIFGDCLEHMTRKEAIALLENVLPKCDDVLVSFPYLNKQSASWFGDNPYEEHVQDDLTRDLILAEYPMLKLLEDNHRTGIFVKK